MLVRRNVNNTPGQKHEDLMIVYSEGGLHAIYFDTEGHTIRYAISLPREEHGGVRFRRSRPEIPPVVRSRGAKLNGKFEVDGKTYLTWTTVRE